jgi:hypothetical protein
MEKIDWEQRLARRHQAPPPAPAGEWQAVLERSQARPSRLRWTLALGGGLAVAGLALFFLLPRPVPVRAAAPEDEGLATEQWVQQQWGSTASGALAEDQAAEPDAEMLKLMDKV